MLYEVITVMLFLPHQVLGVRSDSVFANVQTKYFFFFRNPESDYSVQDFEDYERESEAPDYGTEYCYKLDQQQADSSSVEEPRDCSSICGICKDSVSNSSYNFV